MLKETSSRNDRQNRRWFSDDYFDLIVWIDKDKISGFQLCYDKNNAERALTWTTDKGCRHERIDDGEANPTKNRTPILVSDGVFAAAEITGLFFERSSAIDPDIRAFVLEKLRGYNGWMQNPISVNFSGPVKNKLRISFFFALFIFSAHPCPAAACPDVAQFFKEMDPAQKTWKDFYGLFKSYPSSCDDGMYAEGYSDFVAQSLAKYWDRLDELASLVGPDQSFKNFVLKHIDATGDEDDIKQLLNNAQKKCWPQHVLLCTQIEKAARAALKELEIYQ